MDLLDKIKEAGEKLEELSENNNEGPSALEQLGGLFGAFVNDLQNTAADLKEDEGSSQISGSSWDEVLRPVPKWTKGYDIEFNVEDGYCYVSAGFDSHDQALKAIEEYRDLLVAEGFTPKYEDLEHLCKTADGKTYEVDTEHCFEADDQSPMIYFLVS